MLLNSSAACTDRGNLTERPPRLPAILAHTILLLATRNASCFGQAFFCQKVLISPRIFQPTPLYGVSLVGAAAGGVVVGYQRGVVRCPGQVTLHALAALHAGL